MRLLALGTVPLLWLIVLLAAMNPSTYGALLSGSGRRNARLTGALLGPAWTRALVIRLIHGERARRIVLRAAFRRFDAVGATAARVALADINVRRCLRDALQSPHFREGLSKLDSRSEARYGILDMLADTHFRAAIQLAAGHAEVVRALSDTMEAFVDKHAWLALLRWKWTGILSSQPRRAKLMGHLGDTEFRQNLRKAMVSGDLWAIAKLTPKLAAL